MNSRNFHPFRWAVSFAASLALAGVVLVPGCGGGSGGVGSGGTGGSFSLSQGTVNGFGSVIVDGQRFDDSQIATLTEDAPGHEVQTEAQLGDSVEVEFTTGNVATSLTVQTGLVGSVSAVQAPGAFTVLGQSVVVNSDPALGPVTQFAGGYTGALSIAVGDAVEVHGLVLPAGGANLQATRIERLSALPAYLRVTGSVGGLTGNHFMLGNLQVDASAAALVPPGAALANGEVVAVWATQAALTGSPASPQLAAAQVRVRQLGNAGTQVALSGSVDDLDTTAQRFALAGVQVAYAGATFLPAGANLSDGRYVRASGVLNADGSLQAASITFVDENGPEAELFGNILGLNPVTQTFQVRGVSVDASQAQLNGCPPGGLSEGAYVSIEGTLTATGVLATKVECRNEGGGDTVERQGVASSVDTGALTFVLTPEGKQPLTVRWTPTTYFKGVSPANLAGQKVDVEGTLSGGEIIAQQVTADD